MTPNDSEAEINNFWVTIYIIRSTRHNFLLKKLYSYYSDSYHQFPRQLSTFCLEKKISSKEENSIFR